MHAPRDSDATAVGLVPTVCLRVEQHVPPVSPIHVRDALGFHHEQREPQRSADRAPLFLSVLYPLPLHGGRSGGPCPSFAQWRTGSVFSLQAREQHVRRRVHRAVRWRSKTSSRYWKRSPPHRLSTTSAVAAAREHAAIPSSRAEADEYISLVPMIS